MRDEILVFGGNVFDSSGDSLPSRKDILVAEGKIQEVSKPLQESERKNFIKVVDATDCLVLPGLIDIHVHLREPGQEWKETVYTGTRAAIAGGFTHVCCMPNTQPVNDSVEVTRFIIDKAKEANLARVSPIGAVSKNIAGLEMSQLTMLHEAGCVAFSDDGYPVYDAELMRRALEIVAILGVPITCHEEVVSLTKGGSMNESSLSLKLGLSGMPGVAEDILVARDIELARFTGGHVHICHISTARGVELVRRAKNDGIPVTAEVTPHHLTLTEAGVKDYNTNYKMSPPLRSEADRQALLNGVADSTIDVIATDHAPHDIDAKRVEFSKAAHGIVGLQTALPIVMDLIDRGHLSFKRGIEALTSSPAKVFGLTQGTFTKGSDADIAVFDINAEWTLSEENIFSKSKNTPYIGNTYKCRTKHVLVGGNLVYKDFLFV
jgi:dihydroorotase